MKSNYKTTEERIFAGFRRLSKILKREEFGHHGKARILNVLMENGPMTQRALQDTVEITSSSASELLRKMDDHGLITRTQNPENAKGLIITITEEGKTRARALDAEKAEKTRQLFAALTEEEKESFAAMLDKIQNSWYEEGRFYGDSKRHREKQLKR